MRDKKPPLNYWLSVHGKVRKDIRRYIAILLTVTAIAFIQGWNRQQDMNESYNIAREFTLLLQEGNPRDEVKNLFSYKCNCEGDIPKCDGDIPECEDGHILVRLEHIPKVGWEWEQYLNKNTSSQYFNFGGYKLGLAPFGIFMLLAPSALLLLIYLKIRTLKKISLMLHERAIEYSEVQQSLNSVFNERATQKLGEHRWYYVTAWAVALVILSLMGPIAYQEMNIKTKINTEIDIDKLGYFKPLPDVPLDKRTTKVPLDDDFSNGMVSLFFITLVIGVLIWLSLLQQLNPHPKALLEANKKTS
jgi:hypothetical protein